MSFKKIFTGKPGNIKEFADMIIEKSLPVEVFFFTEIIPTQIGIYHIKGRIVYTERSLENLLLGEGIKYKKTVCPSIFNPEVKKIKPNGPFLGKDMIQLLKKESEQDLKYLSERGIKYSCREFNYADERARELGWI